MREAIIHSRQVWVLEKNGCRKKKKRYGRNKMERRMTSGRESMGPACKSLRLILIQKQKVNIRKSRDGSCLKEREKNNVMEYYRICGWKATSKESQND